jgi:glutaminyl-peptide cyclotransferase
MSDMFRSRNLFLLVFCLVLFNCSPKKNSESVDSRNLLSYSVVKAFPHDVSAFTQGLIVHEGKLFESTGQEGTSWIAEVDITTGAQTKKIVLDNKYFGEGMTILNNKIYQLTYKHHIGFVYDYKTFKKIKEFNFNHEGWGITHDNKKLIASDGTDKLYFLDTLSLNQTGFVTVKEDGISQEKLNELEFIDGFVYANQWQTNYILKIDPSSGTVVGRMDMTDLANRATAVNANADVLNGIAYEKKSKLMLVTGKNWPALFAIRLKKDSIK